MVRKAPRRVRIRNPLSGKHRAPHQTNGDQTGHRPDSPATTDHREEPHNNPNPTDHPDNEPGPEPDQPTQSPTDPDEPPF